jgi:ABC-type antimicrobial peptide transport system permease subunit
LYAVVLGSFGVVSALLICVGIASVCSFDIASRRREIALRMALGGSLRGVGALFARRSLTPLGVGLLSGCLLAYWSSAFLGSLVPGLERVNIAVYVIVVVTAVVSGIGAVVSPISRAIRTAPIGVLKDN